MKTVLLLCAFLQADPIERSFDPKEMRPVLERIASDEFEGRRTGSKGIAKAREYIIGRLKAWGLKPAGADYALSWGTGYNIAVLIGGSDPKLKEEYVLLGAHYDHLGISPWGEGDRIFNGADDNASGTTALMFVAKALASAKRRPKRSVIVVWFSGEEQGRNGAKSYRQRPAVPLEKTVAVLNVDMIGRNPEKEAELFGVGTSPQFAEPVRKAREAVPAARVKAIPGRGSVFHRTDAVVFWSQGIPSMFLFTGFHGDYHRVTDHAEKIDYKRLALLSRFVLELVIKLTGHPGRFQFTR